MKNKTASQRSPTMEKETWLEKLESDKWMGFVELNEGAKWNE